MAFIDPWEQQAPSTGFVDPWASAPASAPTAEEDKPWYDEIDIGKSLASAALQVEKGFQGIKGLLGGKIDPTVVRAAEIAAEDAPVGAFVGDVAKYAPAMLVPGGVLAQAAAGGLMGAGYDTSGDRLSAGLIEGALGGVGAAAGKYALPYLAKKGANIANWGAEKLGLKAADPLNRYGGGLDAARDALHKIIGADNLDAARAALLSARQGTTSAQALAAAGDPVLAAKMGVLDNIARSEGTQAALAPIDVANSYLQTAARQKAAQQATMAQMAGGTTAESAALARKQMGKALEAELGPIREATLAGAGFGQQIDDLLKQADALDYQAMLHGGTSAQAAQLRQTAQGIKDMGFSPLDVSGLTGRIRQVLNEPGLRASVNVNRVLSEVGDNISELVSLNKGRMNPDDLYMLRKEGVNEVVDRLLAGADPAVSKKLTAKLSAELKPYIDDAIENAGGTGWKEYIAKYAEGLENIDRTELMDVLRKLQVDKPKQFMEVIAGENPKVVQKIMAGKAGIQDAVSMNTLTKLREVAGEMGVDRALKEGAKSVEARAAIREVLGNEGLTRYLPNLLNRYAVLANTAIKEGNLKMNKQMYRELDKAMRDPDAMLRLIDASPPEMRSAMIKYATQLGKAGAPAGAAFGEQVRQ